MEEAGKLLIGIHRNLKDAHDKKQTNYAFKSSKIVQINPNNVSASTRSVPSEMVQLFNSRYKRAST